MQYLASLEKLGLEQKEQQIYLTLLQLEKATANQIALKADIKRPTTYDILARLQKEGFVAETTENDKRLFIATPPDKLNELLDEKKRQLDYDLPLLLSIYNSKTNRPKVAYYEGLEGIRQLYEDTLATLKEGDEILAFVTNDTIKYLKDYAVEYVRRRAEKGIFLRGIYENTPELAAHLEKNIEELRSAKTVDPGFFPLKNEINIYANKVIMITYAPEPYGVMIESNEIADTQRSIFEMAWNGIK